MEHPQGTRLRLAVIESAQGCLPYCLSSGAHSLWLLPPVCFWDPLPHKLPITKFLPRTLLRGNPVWDRRRCKECPLMTQVMGITLTPTSQHSWRWRAADTCDVHFRDRVKETWKLILCMQQGLRKCAAGPSSLGPYVTRSVLYRQREWRLEKFRFWGGRSWVWFGVSPNQVKHVRAMRWMEQESSCPFPCSVGVLSAKGKSSHLLLRYIRSVWHLPHDS